MVRQYLAEPAWAGRTLVVLMPTHHVWLDEVSAKRIHIWALDTLASLVARGDVEVLDYTDMFNGESGTDCTAFWDLYHANTSGRARLTEALLGPIAGGLYRRSRLTQ